MMTLHRITLLAYVVICVKMTCAEENEPFVKSGLEVTATTKGINYLTSVAARVLEAEAKKFQVPNFTLPISAPVGSGEGSAANIKIKHFESPDIAVDLEEPDLITVRLSGGNIKVSADWAVRYKVMYIPVTQHGSAEAVVRGIGLNVSARITKKQNGLPHIDIAFCNAKIQQLEPQVTGGVVGPMVELFKGMVVNRVKTAISDLCNKMDAIVKDLAAKITSASFPVAPYLSLDASLIKDPTIRYDYITLDSKAQFQAPEQAEEVTQDDGQVPSVAVDTTKMFRAIVSDSVINSLLNATKAAGGFEFAVNRDSVPQFALAEPFLSSNCPGFPPKCIGRIFKGFGVRFKNASVTNLRLSVSKAPSTIAFGRDVIQASGCIDAKLDIVDHDDTDPDVDATASLDLCATISVERLSVRNGTLHIENVVMQQINAYSTDPASDRLIDDSELLVITDVLKPAVNFLAKSLLPQLSLDLPSITKAVLLNTNLSVLNRAILLETDIENLAELIIPQLDAYAEKMQLKRL